MSYATCIRRSRMCIGCMSCEEEPTGYYNKFGEWVPNEDEDDGLFDDDEGSLFECDGDDDDDEE